MNTIYDNTFVLGQTSATNFIAGPGIKIDETSAGTVRIGNDETVLWSGTRTSAVTLSENAYNFETLQLYLNVGNSNDYPRPVLELMPNNTMTVCWGQGNSNAIITIGLLKLTNNTTLTMEHTKTLSFNSFTSTACTPTATLDVEAAKNSITKVVGINRINA